MLGRPQSQQVNNLPAAFFNIFCSISSINELGQDLRRSIRLWRMKSLISFSRLSVLCDNEIVGTFLNILLILVHSLLENKILHFMSTPVKSRKVCVKISFWSASEDSSIPSMTTRHASIESRSSGTSSPSCALEGGIPLLTYFVSTCTARVGFCCTSWIARLRMMAPHRSLTFELLSQK